MICSGCGARSSAAQRACANCGTQLSMTHVATGVLTPPPVPESIPTQWTPPSAETATLAATALGPIGAGAETSLSPNAPRSGVGGGPLIPGEAFGPRYHIIRLLGV